MPINNQNKSLQLDVDSQDAPYLSRAGGSASRGSSSVMRGTKGKILSAMQSKLLAGLDSTDDDIAKKLSANKRPSRQFNKLSEGGDTKGAVRSSRAYSVKVAPAARERDASPPEGSARAGQKRTFKFQGKSGSVKKVRVSD